MAYPVISPSHPTLSLHHEICSYIIRIALLFSYVHTVTEGTTALDLAGKRNTGEPSLTHEQDMVMAALWSWRDLTAREEDESVAFVMSNAELIRIGQNLPRSMQQLEECGPLSGMVRMYAFVYMCVCVFVCNIPFSSSPSSSPSSKSSLSLM